MVECCAVVSTNDTSLRHSREEAIWLRDADTLLSLSIAHHEIQSHGGVLYITSRTDVIENLFVTGTVGVSCCSK